MPDHVLPGAGLKNIRRYIDIKTDGQTGTEEGGLEKHNRMESTEVRSYIERLESLPTIPIMLKRIMEITRDLSSPPGELYSIISRDPVLAERVLAVANSSFFRHSHGVSDIEQAVMLLGYENIRQITVGIGVFMMLPSGLGMRLQNFWRHSQEVAAIAAMVAERATMLSPSHAFLAGLIHDIGRLVFYTLAHGPYKNLLGTDDLLEKEVSMFGCDHALAGSWLAEKALLPEEHILAIRHHHSPSRAGEYKDMVSVVSIAEALSRRFSPKIEDDGIWTEEHDSILLELSLKEAEMAEIEERLKAEQ